MSGNPVSDEAGSDSESITLSLAGAGTICEHRSSSSLMLVDRRKTAARLAHTCPISYCRDPTRTKKTHIAHLVTVCFEVGPIGGVDTGLFEVFSESDMAAHGYRFGKRLELDVSPVACRADLPI